MYFQGHYIHNLDGKGRTMFPAKFREALDALQRDQAPDADEKRPLEVTITLGLFERCLKVYPREFWEEQKRKLDALPHMDPVASKLRRLMVGMSYDATIDDTGRFLIPQPLRARIGMKKEIAVVGSGSYIEIWDAAEWQGDVDDALADLETLSSYIEKFGL